jgi:CRP-like cAMP-binding protein
VDAATEQQRQRENAQNRATADRLHRERLAHQLARLDRAMVAETIGKITDQLAACSDRAQVNGSVVVSVQVAEAT